MPPKDLPQPSPEDTGSPERQAFQLPIRSYDSEARRLATEEINRELQTDGLTVNNAIRIIQLGPLDDSMSTPVRRTAAVGLGLCEVDHPAFQEFDTSDLSNITPAVNHNRRYGDFLRQIDLDVKAAVYFTEFQIDPKEVVREYREFPWEESLARHLRAGEALPAKPSFATFAKMILRSAILIKSEELYDKEREIRSTISSESFTFGPGFRDTQIRPEDQEQLEESKRYGVAVQTLRQTVNNFDKPRELEGVSNLTWLGLSGGLVNGRIKELASTQALVKNSQFVDDILKKTEPVIPPYPEARPQPPKVDLATIIIPKPIPK